MNYIIRNNKESIIGSEIITLHLLKSFLKITNDAQDDLLKELLTMSIQYAEWYMEKSLVKQIWKMICIGMVPRILFIPFGPLISVNKVNFYYNDVVNDLTEGSDYKVENLASYLELVKVPSKGKLEINYTSGYEKGELVPENIKEGILKHVSYVYHQTQDEEKMAQIKRVYEKFKELKVVL